MGPTASQITSLTTVFSTVYSDADQRKRQSSASLAFVRGIHRGPVNSPHKWPVGGEMFPFDDVIMRCTTYWAYKWRSNRRSSYIHSVSDSLCFAVMTSQSIGQCIMGPNNCYTDTRKVVSNSLDIDITTIFKAGGVRKYIVTRPPRNSVIPI